MIYNTSFDKNEYLNNNPDQGIAISQSVRDSKSHSKTYFKQATARDQKLAETINKLPNKMKNQLAIPIMTQMTKSTITKPASKKKKTNAPRIWDFDYSEDYVADAMDEIADEEAIILEEIQQKQVEMDTAEYQLLVQQWQADDKIHADDIIFDNDVESVDEEAFIIHYKNRMALEDYYMNLTPENTDEEYEFWLTFEIRAFEEGSRNITEIFRPELEFDDDEDRYKKDADDLMQEYIESRQEDAMDDADY